MILSDVRTDDTDEPQHQQAGKQKSIMVVGCDSVIVRGCVEANMPIRQINQSDVVASRDHSAYMHDCKPKERRLPSQSRLSLSCPPAEPAPAPGPARSQADRELASSQACELGI